jgi:hypothetical protein
MSDLEYGFIGWNTEGTSDKVWGYFLRPIDRSKPWSPRQHVVVFWAKRGKAMRFKPDFVGTPLNRLVGTKINDGYVSISSNKLYEIWPDFVQSAKEKLMFEVLAGKIP